MNEAVLRKSHGSGSLRFLLWSLQGPEVVQVEESQKNLRVACRGEAADIDHREG